MQKSNNNNGGNTRKRKNAKKKAKRRNGRGPQPSQLNGSSRRGERDISLALTGTQFTATSPMRYIEYTKASTPGGLRCRGRDWLGAISVPTTTGAYQNVFVPDGSGTSSALFAGVSPALFPRLKALGYIFEQYIFHKIIFTYQSALGTTTNGAISFCIDYDYGDAIVSSTTEINNNVTSVMSNIYSDSSMVMLGSLSRLPKYFCQTGLTSPSIDQYQGLLRGATSGYNNSPSVTTQVGFLFAEYDVEFFTPCSFSGP